jgi:hypothetical protein
MYTEGSKDFFEISLINNDLWDAPLEMNHVTDRNADTWNV